MEESASIDRRKRRSKQAFRDAFADLLIEKDLNHITVKELTERADRDRKTFYLHYDSIDGLVDELLHEEIERIVGLIGDAALDENGKVEVAELFETMSIELVSSFNKRSTVMRHVDTDKLISRMRPILASEIIKRDSFGLVQVLGPYLEPFASFYCAGLLALYHQWTSSDSELPMDQLAELASAATAGGIGALVEAASALDIN